MSTFETRVTALAVSPMGEPLHSEMTTMIMIADEAAGEYVEVIQTGRRDLGKIAIDPDQWPAMRAAIDRLIAECTPVESDSTRATQRHTD